MAQNFEHWNHQVVGAQSQDAPQTPTGAAEQAPQQAWLAQQVPTVQQEQAASANAAKQAEVEHAVDARQMYAAGDTPMQPAQSGMAQVQAQLGAIAAQNQAAQQAAQQAVPGAARQPVQQSVQQRVSYPVQGSTTQTHVQASAQMPQAQQASAPQSQASAQQAWQQQQPVSAGVSQQAQSQQQASAASGAPQAPVGASAYASAVPLQSAPVEKKNGHGWIVAIVIIVCLFVFMGFCVKACTDSMSSLSSLSTTSGYGLEGLEGDAVAMLDIDGTIQYDGTACSPEGFKQLLDQAQEDEHVKALVIRVNSGGGAATAGEEMAEYLRQFDKPVVISSASINASAAYEISSQADYIYVAKSTEIGAIGTVMQVTDLSSLFEKLGIKMETIASADSKDSSYGYRPLTDEERKYYQRMINQINDIFIDNVAQGRHMEAKDVEKLATGLVFTGVDAVDNGLADAIGTREDAVKKAAELAGISDYTTATLTMSSYDFGDLAYLLGESRSSANDLIDMLDQIEQGELRH